MSAAEMHWQTPEDAGMDGEGPKPGAPRVL